jgi:hypothetical protein
MEQGLEVIREELGRGRVGGADIKEALQNKGNINILSQWIMKDVIKEELDEMKELEVDRGLGKTAVQQTITKVVKEFFLSHI